MAGVTAGRDPAAEAVVGFFVWAVEPAVLPCWPRLLGGAMLRAFAGTRQWIDGIGDGFALRNENMSVEGKFGRVRERGGRRS